MTRHLPLHRPASQDLAGGKSPDNLFFEVSDTYSNGFNPRLYRPYVDVHAVEALSILRVGRQQDVETPEPAYYDGVHVRSRGLAEDKLHVGGYGGFSTHIFESTDTNDRVFGLYAGAKPWNGGRLRLDWMRARDHRRTAGAANDIYSIGVWQSVASTVDVEGFFSRFRGKNRDLRLSGVWYEPDFDLQVRGRYYQLLSRQTTSALEVRPVHEQPVRLRPLSPRLSLGLQGLHVQLSHGRRPGPAAPQAQRRRGPVQP